MEEAASEPVDAHAIMLRLNIVQVVMEKGQQDLRESQVRRAKKQN